MEPIFPGMNPYLESPGLWPGFLDSFISYTRETIQPLLPEKYYADLQTREEVGISGSMEERTEYPDVVVKKLDQGTRETRKSSQSGNVSTIPELLVIPEIEPIRISYIEIREATGMGKLVTLIELLSPSNKYPGVDREVLERKQNDIMASDVNWLEIDLLRGGKRIACHPKVDLYCQKKERLSLYGDGHPAGEALPTNRFGTLWIQRPRSIPENFHPP